jgi:hypothetical protein
MKHDVSVRELIASLKKAIERFTPCFGDETILFQFCNYSGVMTFGPDEA